jgi:hypothetical protein
MNNESTPKTNFNLTSKIVDRYSITQKEKILFQLPSLLGEGPGVGFFEVRGRGWG